MNQTVVKTNSRDVMCFGEDDWGGHPTVFYTIGSAGQVTCGYCNKLFIYEGKQDDE